MRHKHGIGYILAAFIAVVVVVRVGAAFTAHSNPQEAIATEYEVGQTVSVAFIVAPTTQRFIDLIKLSKVDMERATLLFNALISEGEIYPYPAGIKVIITENLGSYKDADGDVVEVLKVRPVGGDKGMRGYTILPVNNLGTAI